VNLCRAEVMVSINHACGRPVLVDVDERYSKYVVSVFVGTQWGLEGGESLCRGSAKGVLNRSFPDYESAIKVFKHLLYARGVQAYASFIKDTGFQEDVALRRYSSGILSIEFLPYAGNEGASMCGFEALLSRQGELIRNGHLFVCTNVRSDPNVSACE
jgi:hypothetical protein